MNHIISRITAVFCGVAAAVSLTGCNLLTGGFDASGYVQGILDSTYHGIHDSYMEITNATEEEAKAGYKSGLETEAGCLAQYLGFGDYFASEEMDPNLKQEMMDYYRELYANSRYEVEKAVKTDSGYNVEVSIEPIEIMSDAMEDLNDYLADFGARTDQGEFDALSDADYYKTYGEGAMEILNSYLDRFTYGEELSVVVLVYEESDGVYTISDNDFENLNASMIVYP